MSQESSAPVRVRFAPSPTGYIHMGNVRSALFNYVFARARGGDFLIRIEDTDLERHVEGSDRDILEVLSWLGLNWDEGPRVRGPKGPYYQSLRLETYRVHAQDLVDRGLAYYDFSSKPPEKGAEKDKSPGFEIQWQSPDAALDPAEARRRVEAGEPHAIRMRVREDLYPDRQVKVADIVHGTMSQQVEDFVIIKQNGFPTYHFGVVCDDHAMGITHVIRGIGHLPNTPKHRVLYEAFGWPMPQWAHHSHTAGLSKRMGSPSVGDLMRRGYLPEAVGNACLLMGWFPKDNREFFRFEERIEGFKLEDLGTSEAGNFDLDKFHFLCQKHMEAAEAERVLNMARPFLESSGFIAEGAGRAPDDPMRPKLLAIIDWAKSRVTHAAQILDVLGPFKPAIALDDDARQLLGTEEARLVLRTVLAAFEAEDAAGASSDELAADAFRALTKGASKDGALKERKIKGRGFFHPLRAALCGSLEGPDLGLLASVIGRGAVMERLKAGIGEG